MKNIEISDELYEELKAFVVDPFDDTTEIVINRLVEIVNKAKDRWSSMDDREYPAKREIPMAERTRISNQAPEDAEQAPVLL
jgi:predicted CopG family antitoxin